MYNCSMVLNNIQKNINVMTRITRLVIIEQYNGQKAANPTLNRMIRQQQTIKEKTLSDIDAAISQTNIEFEQLNQFDGFTWTQQHAQLLDLQDTLFALKQSVLDVTL